ncbi:ATP-grasp domain-containing protein [Thioalkalivibrio sp. ALE9]|uniref:ATP-binding protein n=1 Tax=Thioalkalivibrio sp. ALE9 TaxID=1158169 RepID=UPI00037BCECB|nr:ATP-grasp domain-containing protein [Thioalkalivibrio sp. ALE9]
MSSPQPPMQIAAPSVRVEGYTLGLGHPTCWVPVVVNRGSISRDALGILQERLAADLSERFWSPLDSFTLSSADPGELTAFVLRWVFNLQQVAGLSVFEPGQPVSVGSEGHRWWLAATTSAHAQPATERAVSWLIETLAQSAAGDPQDPSLEGLETLLEFMGQFAAPASNLPRFLRAAFSEDIPVASIDGQVYQFGQGIHARRIDAGFTDTTSNIAVRLARHKRLAAIALRRLGVPVPPHLPARNIDDAREAASRIGYPVVIKPANMDGGVGVTAGIRGPESVPQAYSRARKHSDDILVERYVEGRDYRLLVFQGELIWAVERVPGGVTGDGQRTVAELLDLLNTDPRRGRNTRAPSRKLVLDREASELLAEAGLSEHSVPQPGEFVRLRRTANIATGGTPIAVFDDVHPDNAELAVRATAAVGLDLCGVDMLIPDIRKSWLEGNAWVYEVNAQPDMGQTTSTRQYPRVLSGLVQGRGRVPIVVLLGDAPDNTGISPEIATRLMPKDSSFGRLDSNGVFLRDQPMAPGRMGLFHGGSMLLSHPRTECLLVSINDAELVRSGLPFDRFDALVLAGTHISPAEQEGDASSEQTFSRILSALLPHCAGPVLQVSDGSGPALQAAPGTAMADKLRSCKDREELLQATLDILRGT